MTVDDTFETKFDKEFDVNNIEHIYYLQLNNRLLDKLNIINKIKLCKRCCIEPADDISIIINSIINTNDHLKEILKRIYKIVINIQRLKSYFNKYISEKKFKKDQDLEEVFNNFIKLFSKDIKSIFKKSIKVENIKRLNEIFNYENRDLIKKWQQYINKILLYHINFIIFLNMKYLYWNY